MKKFEKVLATLAVIYFFTGLIFAVGFAIYYHWSYLSFLSPGFFTVLFTWPLQLPGMISDLQNYGLVGKPS